MYTPPQLTCAPVAFDLVTGPDFWGGVTCVEHSVSEMVADVCVTDVEPAMTQVAAPAVQGLAWATLPDLPHYRNGVILVFGLP